MNDVIILGSGPAGFTAAIYTSRALLKTLIVAGSKWGGQLMLTTEVENFPGFAKGIQGSELMNNLRQQAERFGAKVVEEDVLKVNFFKRLFVIKTKNSTYQARAVIIATGASTKWLNIPGEQRLIGRGVSSCAPCDAFFFKDKQVIVVGGGDSAMEEALILTKFASQTTIVHRRNEFRASKIMQDRVLKNEKIKVLWNTVVEEIIGKDKVEAVKLKNLKGKERQMPIDGVFVAIGHKPNTDIFKNSGLELDEKGYIKKISKIPPEVRLARNGKYKMLKIKKEKWQELVKKYPSMTNIEGVFVAGDVSDYTYRQAITAAGFGCMAAMDAQKWLEDQDSY